MERQQKNEQKKYALVVGVNSSAVMLKSPEPLKYAESGAKGISHLLGRKACNFVSPVKSLTGTEANANSVRKAIVELIKDKGENDLLLFYFVGHGFSIEIDGKVETYLVTSDFDFELAVDYAKAYLSVKDIREKLFEPQSKTNVICILDCCHAGAILEPDSPKHKLVQALETFINDALNASQTSTSFNMTTKVVLASTGPETNAYCISMTNLIIDILNGGIPDALDRSDGNLTLLTLYSYLQKTSWPEEQKPIMDGRFGSFPWVLAHHPQESRVLREREDYPQPIQPPQFPVKQPFDTLPSEAAFTDLDLEQIREFLKKEKVQLQRDYRPDLAEEALMQALGLMQNEHPSYGALLCFGHNPSHRIVGAYTRCIYWSNRERLSDQIDDREYRGSLLEQFTQVCNFLRKHLRVIDHDGSSEQPEIPFRVLKEAVANALAHREYVTDTESVYKSRTEGIQVEIFSDRVEITSPGESLVQLNPKHPISCPRNPEIQRIFYLAEHVEKISTGLMRMKRQMQEVGLPEPIIKSKEQMFTITLSRVPQPIGDTLVSKNLTSSDETNTQLNGSKPTPTTTSSTCYDDPVPIMGPPAPPTGQSTTALVAVDSDNGSCPPPVNGEQPQPLIKTSGALNSSGDYEFLPQPPKRNMPFVLLSVLVIVVIIICCVISKGSDYILGHSPTPTPSLVPASTTIEIASDFPTSGLDTTNGLPLQKGVQMAITEANNEHLLPGYTLKLVPYDDVKSGNHYDPQAGATNLSQAIADNLVAGVIGPYNSSVALKQLPLANQAPLALLSPAVTYPCLTKSAKDDPNCVETSDIATQMRPNSNLLTFFRLATTDDQQGKAAADYFIKTKNYSKVLLLKDDHDPYSFGLAQAFSQEWRQMGGTVIPIGITQSESNVSNYQNTIQASAPPQLDLIYFAGATPNGYYALQALSNLATLKTVPFAGGDGLMNPQLLQMAASLPQSPPIYVSLPIEDPDHSGTSTGANFKANYMANGHNENEYRPSVAAAYDCTIMLIQAIQAALDKGVSTPHGAQDHAGAVKFRLAVLQALKQLSYTGATGTHSFDANGDTTNHSISFYHADLSTPQPSWTWLVQVNGK